MKCVNGLDIRVLKSGAGWYIGTLDEDGCPNCRISVDYYPTKESAQKDLDNRCFAFRLCGENRWCANRNGNLSCFVKGGC